MTTIRNLVSLIAAIPTPTAMPGNARACGEVNVFYTGYPPYHPMVLAQGWDPVRVEIGLRSEAVALVNAGYNVQIVWAGNETPPSVLSERMDATGVDYDIVGVGFGVRGGVLPAIVERFEDLIDFFKHKVPDTPIVFNHNPESLVWSVSHRMPLMEDCQAVGKPGRLIGYEEICDGRCDHGDQVANKSHDEL